jgi:phosphatidyl-myo-inositol alpha-mannosyltransferase
MKVLLSTPFDIRYPGGVNANIQTLDQELQRLGHQTRILSPGAPDGTVDDDGHVCRIGHAWPIPANGSLARLALSARLSRYVREFLDREAFDVVHLNDPLTSTLHLTVLACSKTVNVGTFHASNTSYLGYNLLYRLGRPFFSMFERHIDYRIAVSPTARDFISHYFPGNYDLIPNGIDFDRFGPHVSPAPSFASDRPTVLFVGRYNESRKGFRYLLEAMKQVSRGIPNARLLVVGPGTPTSFRPLLQTLAPGSVEFTGEVSAEDLPALYASADVFCAPSTGRESFGIVLLEAMAAGKPVVASDIPGYRTVIRSGNEAKLVPPANPELLGDAILSVLRNPELASRLGDAGRRRAQECAWHNIAQRVVECYERARTPASNGQPSLAPQSSLFSGTRRP